MPCDMRYKAVIFDMDGTILDTSQDLTAAVNYAMAEFGHRSDFPVEDGCLFFGSGAHTAIQRALAREAGMDREQILQIGSAKNSVVPGIDEDEVLRILEVYQPYYKAHNAIRTSAYPGISDLLRQLRSAGERRSELFSIIGIFHNVEVREILGNLAAGRRDILTQLHVDLVDRTVERGPIVLTERVVARRIGNLR